ncbi:hypothetical protein Anapl_09479 [Anas platyrhynchos]|uniref:Uncharacterized protein n=1 Tax=Anas platyrhynchos TaxID=8839 RepID=R0KZ69_ANAPL|nr:hypothetical protein Anapl_09479 [Anas platyrhynchos]
MACWKLRWAGASPSLPVPPARFVPWSGTTGSHEAAPTPCACYIHGTLSSSCAPPEAPLPFLLLGSRASASIPATGKRCPSLLLKVLSKLRLAPEHERGLWTAFPTLFLAVAVRPSCSGPLAVSPAAVTGSTSLTPRCPSPPHEAASGLGQSRELWGRSQGQSFGAVVGHGQLMEKGGGGAVVPVAKLAKELSPEQGRFQQQQFPCCAEEQLLSPSFRKATGNGSETRNPLQRRARRITHQGATWRCHRCVPLATSISCCSFGWDGAREHAPRPEQGKVAENNRRGGNRWQQRPASRCRPLSAGQTPCTEMILPGDALPPLSTPAGGFQLLEQLLLCMAKPAGRALPHKILGTGRPFCDVSPCHKAMGRLRPVPRHPLAPGACGAIEWIHGSCNKPPRQLTKWDGQRPPHDVSTVLVVLWCCYNTRCRDSGS